MSSLQNKLYNYEQIPPEKVWDKIAAALDESHIDDEFPSTIYNAETIPPTKAWDKIASSLEAEQPGVVPMARKSFPLFRYAAAAAIIGLVTFGVIKWVGGNNDKSVEGFAVATDTTRSENKTDLPNEKNTAEVNREKENVITKDNITDIATTELVKAAPIKKAKNKYSIPDNIDADEPIYAYNDHTPNLADRYIMLMTPGGDIIRMSKKWGHLVCCVSGQEQDENCKDQLKKWQEKIASSPITTSPGNFMDILSLVSSLNENEL
jgi:hypothetical protein